MSGPTLELECELWMEGYLRVAGLDEAGRGAWAGPVVAAAVSISPDHETWVLDDGNRREIEEMAHTLGAHYLARGENKDAKAGNINSALRVVEADLIAVLDADHVVGPDFLHHTLCLFHGHVRAANHIDKRGSGTADIHIQKR